MKGERMRTVERLNKGLKSRPTDDAACHVHNQGHNYRISRGCTDRDVDYWTLCNTLFVCGTDSCFMYK